MSAGHTDQVGIEYLNGLYSYSLVLTGNHAEAEDLVQETYVRAIPAMDRLRPNSNMKAWLFTIMRNVWLNQLRKLRNSPHMITIEVDHEVVNHVTESSMNPHDLYVSKLEVGQLREAIQELPVEFREIILLREFEGLSYKEIASVIDRPIGTVMSRLARARGKLRDILSNKVPGSICQE